MTRCRTSYPIRVKSFTLIELLVVVAIIGILATMASVAASEARKKGKDVGIIADLSQVRIEAVLILDKEDSYTNLCDTGTLNNGNPTLDLIEKEVKKHNGNQDIICFASADAYCVQSPLATFGAYCIDSIGYAGKTANCTSGHIACQ